MVSIRDVAVDPTQMQPTWRALLEDIELIPQDDDFGSQPPSRLEAVAQHADEEEALVLAEEPDVRRFFTFDRDGKLVAFSFFDPVYEAGKLVEYGSQHNRHLPEADHMVNFAIKRVAIETFQREGLKVLHLGISPFADVLQDQEFKSNKSWTTSHYFDLAYKSWLVNRYIYPIKGIAAHRRLFRGVQRQTYYAFNRRPSLPRVLKLLQACNIV